jgi:hypothetical protein
MFAKTPFKCSFYHVNNLSSETQKIKPITMDNIATIYQGELVQDANTHFLDAYFNFLLYTARQKIIAPREFVDPRVENSLGVLN